MNDKLKMIMHDMIEYATQALKRYDKDDDHWKTLMSLLRFEAIKYVEIFEKEEEE